MPNSGLCCPGRAQSKIERKQKERSVPRLCEGTEKLWNMKITVIPIVIGALGTLTNRISKRTGGIVETTQTIELLISARILRRILET